MIKAIKGLLLLILLAAIGVVAFIYSGVYDIGADSPHYAVTRWALHTTMDRSVARHAAEISVPSNLNDPAVIRTGAEHYAEMCVECHLAPGKTNSELRDGLYPKPPELAYSVADMSPGELFWITKHGVKMSAMPAWGKTHPDEKIWAIVAFTQKLPRMTPTQYKELTASSEGEAAHEHDKH